MICTNCHNEETNSTTGLCWRCIELAKYPTSEQLVEIEIIKETICHPASVLSTKAISLVVFNLLKEQ